MKNQRYNAFLTENELRKDFERVKVGGFGRKQSAKASGAATRYQKQKEKENNGYKSVENSADYGNMRTGAKSGAWTSKNDPYFKERDRVAKEYYQEVLGRKREYEIDAIAKSSGFSKEDINKVFSHVFEKEHLFADGSRHKFSPDYDMSQSWIRLREGKNIKEHDMILLNHELMEANIMAKSDVVYESAHSEAEEKYNYSKALKKYLKDNDLE